MSKSKLPKYEFWVEGEYIGTSIFPKFDVGVPMPKGTGIPPIKVVVARTADGKDPGSDDTGSAPKQG